MKPILKLRDPNSPGLILGKGKYRTTFRLDESTCIKVMLPQVEFHFGPIQLTCPTRAFTLFNFDIDDFNQYEFDNYLKYFKDISVDLRGYFVRLFGVKDGILKSELVRDFDWSISETLEQHKQVDSVEFWNRLMDIQRFILAQNIPFYTITSANIMVKKISKSNSIPVFTDFKHIGQRLFPLQMWLRIKLFSDIKIRRQFRRLVLNHAPEEIQKQLL